MLISRTIARKRIARGERPSFRAAWAPVVFDTLIVAGLLALLASPALTFVYVMELSLIWTMLWLLVLFYVPLQIVIIVSSMWAVRSRWQDKDGV